MKRILTFFVSVFLFTMVMGQPTAVIKKTTVAPVIDGMVDDVWATVDPIAIDVPMTVLGVAETPTVGNSWWKALWNDDGIYLLCYVDDDVFVPAYMGANPVNSWMYDKPEIYFDCNAIKKDGRGTGNGHYQFAPTEIEALVNGGTATVDPTSGYSWAFNASANPKYYVEYFFPFSVLLDIDGAQVDRTEPIGFDISIQDNDILTDNRDRMDWSNAGAINESNSNMDDSGLITLEGAEPPTYVDEVTLNAGGTITVDNGTLQMVPAITPSNATIKNLKWTVVNLTGIASIDSKGLLTALANGTVSVKASATDGMGAEALVDVEISGQQISKSEVWNGFNLIKNWDLDTDVTSWSGWTDTDPLNGLEGQVGPVIEDGHVVMQSVQSIDGNNWHYQFNQINMGAEANVPYILKFKSWSDGERLNGVDFEDIAANNYNNRYGATPDAESGNGRSEWLYTTTNEPTWFTFHVTFDQMVETTVQKVQWLESQAGGTVYLDSVLLVKASEFALMPTLTKDIASSINRVYPSPVGDGNTLFVELSSTKINVAIYNAVGQKLMEKVSTGTITKFDVSSLRKGLYFVKLGDGSTQKFIR